MQLPGIQCPKIKSCHISENGVFMLLDWIHVSKSSGPDKLPGILLQCLAKEITPIVHYIIYVWKILEGLVHNLFPPICTLMLDDWEHWSITALDGVPSVWLTNYLCLYVIPRYVLFIFSRNNWIATCLQCLILHVNQDLTTAWIMEIG